MLIGGRVNGPVSFFEGTSPQNNCGLRWFSLNNSTIKRKTPNSPCKQRPPNGPQPCLAFPKGNQSGPCFPFLPRACTYLKPSPAIASRGAEHFMSKKGSWKLHEGVSVPTVGEIPAHILLYIPRLLRWCVVGTEGNFKSKMEMVGWSQSWRRLRQFVLLVVSFLGVSIFWGHLLRFAWVRMF